MASKIILTYFPIEARALPIRLAFHISGIGMLKLATMAALLLQLCQRITPCGMTSVMYRV